MCKNNTRNNNNNNNKELTHIWIHPPFNRMIHLLVPKIKSQDLFVFFCQTILLFQMRNLKHSVGCFCRFIIIFQLQVLSEILKKYGVQMKSFIASTCVRSEVSLQYSKEECEQMSNSWTVIGFRFTGTEIDYRFKAAAKLSSCK